MLYDMYIWGIGFSVGFSGNFPANFNKCLELKIV
jgi:hypothetical protein